MNSMVPHRAALLLLFLTIIVTYSLAASPLARAHFGMVIPSSNQVNQAQKEIEILFSFLHPFENKAMDLEWPRNVFVSANGSQQDLKGLMLKTSLFDRQAWNLSYMPPRPGVYWFVMEPEPYWEPTEDIFIIHYTKTAVSAYGGDQGWDTPIGLKTEIVPLLRPFGNYAGNSFTGKVLVDNSPVPHSDVEVELYNQEGWVAPTDAHITQVVKTDENGVFSFTCPLPGWWGFSALTEADYSLKTEDGKEKRVEQGAVIWVYFDPNPFLDR